MAAILLAYNVGATVYFPLVATATAAFSTAASGSLSGTNIYIIKDGGALATSTNTGTAIGSGIYSLVLTTSELSAKQVMVLIGRGTLGTIVENQAILIQTFGSASAFYPFDLGTALSAQTVGTVSFVATGTISTVTSPIGTVSTVIFLASGTITTLLTPGTPAVNVVQFLGTAATGTQGVIVVDVSRWSGTAVSGSAGLPKVSTVNFLADGTVSTALGIGSANVVQFLGTGATGTQGIVQVDVSRWKGTGVPGTSGTPDVGTVTTVLGGTIGTVTGTQNANVVLWQGTSAAGTQGKPNVGTADFLATGTVSTVTSIVSADVRQIAGSATAASNLARSAGVIGSGTTTGTITAASFEVDLTQGLTDYWKGRIVIFISGTLQYMASDITAYRGSAAGVLARLSVTTMAGAPAAGDQFVLL